MFYVRLQVVYKTSDDHVTVVGAGVTLQEALAAAEMLKKGRERKTRTETNHRQQKMLDDLLHIEMLFFFSFSLERINIRVIDPFTIKPLDSKTIIDSARATRGRIITVEDHYYEGTPFVLLDTNEAFWLNNM